MDCKSFDEQVAQKDPEIKKLTDEFVRVRVVRMNQANVDLNIFEFDYDLTWAAFFLNQHGHVYARYGVRKEKNAESMISEEGFKGVMAKVLQAHQKGKNIRPKRKSSTPKLPESFRTLNSKLRTGKSCMHCHQVWDYMRKDNPSWDKTNIAREYPLAENLGFSFVVDKGNIVDSVASSGFARKAGLRAGDEVTEANDTPVYSSADLSWVLHHLKKGSTVKLKVKRGGSPKTISIRPTGDWRSRDFFWRGSMWALDPKPGFGGKQLTDSELRNAGLNPGVFAIRVRYIVNWGGDSHEAGKSAIRAGLKKGDIVYNVAGKADFPSELHFQSWFRLNMIAGRTVPIGIIRNGNRQTLKLKVTNQP